MSGQTVILAGDRQRELAKRLIDKAPPRAAVTIAEESRSLDQNRKMRAMISDVSRARPMGRIHSTETWKCLLMDLFAGENGQPKFRPRWEPALDGNGVVNVGYRSSKLTKSEMSEFIEWLYAWGAEQGVRWSEPNPYDQEQAA
jgi:hypothetical protein